MADHSAPDYELEPVLHLDEPGQYKALFDETRLEIIQMLGERAATVSQLAEALGKPKGSVGHHVGVLEQAGLIRVIRTEKVRAIEAKYYGRTARTFDYSLGPDYGIAPNHALAVASREMMESRERLKDLPDLPGVNGVRYARIPIERAAEFAGEVWELVERFVSEPRGGDIVYGFAVAFYPTDKPHLS